MAVRSVMRLAAISLVLASAATRGDEPKDAGRGDATHFPGGGPAELGIDKAALERLRQRARETDSDAVVIIKDGRLVADWDFGRERGPIQAMSVTKSIVNLAIGRLVDQGKIESLDQPVYEFYPEWNQGRKRLITVRHLLNHTSGLQCSAATGEIENSPDSIQFALAAELTDDPGSRFYYNNKAVNLLSGIVEHVSGARMDVFIGKEVFGPLGIKDYTWSQDHAGHSFAMAGLHIRAIDLAKVGQMMLDGGAWKGRPVVSKEWVRRSLEPGQALNPDCGLLWWRYAGPKPFAGASAPAVAWLLAVDDAFVKFYKDRGMTPQSEEKLEALKNKPMESGAFWTAIREILHRDKVLRTKLVELNKDLPPVKSILDGTARPNNDPPPANPNAGAPMRGYAGIGSLGQYLFVMPGHRLVAVRQRRKREGTNPEDWKAEFGEFPGMVEALVRGEPK